MMMMMMMMMAPCCNEPQRIVTTATTTTSCPARTHASDTPTNEFRLWDAGSMGERTNENTT